MRVRRRHRYRVNQLALTIHPNVRFHPKIPLPLISASRRVKCMSGSRRFALFLVEVAQSGSHPRSYPSTQTAGFLSDIHSLNETTSRLAPPSTCRNLHIVVSSVAVSRPQVNPCKFLQTSQVIKRVLHPQRTTTASFRLRIMRLYRPAQLIPRNNPRHLQQKLFFFGLLRIRWFDASFSLPNNQLFCEFDYLTFFGFNQSFLNYQGIRVVMDLSKP